MSIIRKFPEIGQTPTTNKYAGQNIWDGANNTLKKLFGSPKKIQDAVENSNTSASNFSNNVGQFIKNELFNFNK